MTATFSNLFKPGDIVQLKSGGPAMTVSEIWPPFNEGQVEIYHCEWFKGASSESAQFQEATLKLYVAPKKA